MPDLDAMWHTADAALLRCLELAHQSFLARGLPVGSVIIARGGEKISEGRNRAYDPAGGPDRLQRTPIAHAEMNALAGIDTGTVLGGMTLWSSHRPCMMCAAACEFTGVGAVTFIAPDPSDGEGGEDPAHRRHDDSLTSDEYPVNDLGAQMSSPFWCRWSKMSWSTGDTRARSA